jgi:hypothetical protein
VARRILHKQELKGVLQIGVQIFHMHMLHFCTKVSDFEVNNIDKQRTIPVPSKQLSLQCRLNITYLTNAETSISLEWHKAPPSQSWLSVVVQNNHPM